MDTGSFALLSLILFSSVAVSSFPPRRDGDRAGCPTGRPGGGGGGGGQRRARHPRDVSGAGRAKKSRFGSAAYFSDRRQMLRLKTAKDERREISRQQFTVEVWVKPEGGQADPAVIVGLIDVCGSQRNSKGWSVGIRTADGKGERDARVYFSLETQRAREPTVIMADKRYFPQKWVHLTASYNGQKMKLYINSALVGVAHQQKGDIFSPSEGSCKEIHMGGNFFRKTPYRGYVDELRIWNFAYKHSDVVQNLYDPSVDASPEKGIVLRESFDDLKQWKSLSKKFPELLPSNIEHQMYDIALVTPPCGQTVCDDPDVVRSYTKHWELRREKVVRYRIVNVMSDDGSKPRVTSNQTRRQHRAILNAFGRYNVTWKLEEVKVKNSSLLQKTILFGCESSKIGNGHCDFECQHALTGNDGGDCDPFTIPCEPGKLRNGRCDYECNRFYHKWDGGDCCGPTLAEQRYCFDPRSPYRTYLSIQEYKTILNMGGSTHLNVFFVSWTSDNLIGVATFPWEKHVYNYLGGTVVLPQNFGQPGKLDDLIHEFGHNLGLWHVHRGVSDLPPDDPCAESHASMELGDLCSDTEPTPKNSDCRDPPSSSKTHRVFKNTPFRNYMSYSDEDCADHFTPQQTARMHCYIDFVYQSWQTLKKPSPVPLPPKVVAMTSKAVTLVWIPPLGDNVYGTVSICRSCTESGSLIQYASTATTPIPSLNSFRWSPEQATGPPDAEMCKADIRAWNPDSYKCNGRCYIEFGFQEAVVPQRIRLWVSWNAAGGIKSVKFIFKDGSKYSLKVVTPYCDMPFTAKLDYREKVDKVRIYTSNPDVSIDAVELLSAPKAHACSSCRPTKYRIVRTPPFPGDISDYISGTRFTDSTVIRGMKYSYYIQATIANKKVSDPSPTLTYIHGEPFCGNGRVESDLLEDCDDGNVDDGDGCTVDCKVEEFFRCKASSAGSPSLCYRYDGDGICEEFERSSSLRDCGFYTPEGYEDQWPVTAVANPQFQLPLCPESVLVGQPSLTQTCKFNPDFQAAWQPCGSDHDYNTFWVTIGFPKAVIATWIILYLGSDGRPTPNAPSEFVSVRLIDTNGASHPIGQDEVAITCATNPAHVPVLHNLTEPFFYTKSVNITLSSSRIALTGIRLRSSRTFDPVTVRRCTKEQFFNPRSNQCVNQTCPKRFCERLAVKHGNATCTGCGEGDTCKLACDSGYHLKTTSDEVMCVDGKWKSSSEVACVPVDCGPPTILHASSACTGGTTFGKRCAFKCSPPARLQGASSTVRCEADGQWSMADAFCLTFCESPVYYGSADLKSRRCKQNSLKVGTRCKMRCRKGHKVEGKQANRRVVKLTCGDDGQWAGKKCVRIQCPPIPLVFTGLYNCTDGRREGSSCTVHCPFQQQIQTITCQQSGEWDKQFRLCEFPTDFQCSHPVTSQPGVSFDCPEKTVGSICHAQCSEKSFQPALSFTDGTAYRPSQSSISFMCTGSSTWRPDPKDIKCEEKCNRKFLSDGWCDRNNNRAFCNWDEGDCCSSTVKGGQVVGFPFECTVDCKCKDPKATENSNKSKRT